MRWDPTKQVLKSMIDYQTYRINKLLQLIACPRDELL